MTRFVLVALAAATMTNLSAQQPQGACTSAAHRNFDFWVGQWEVADSGGHMVAESTNGRNRMNWTLLPDGRVRQWQENSTDGGATWTTRFVGYYRRTG